MDIAADIPEYLSRVDEFSARLDEGSIQPTGLQSSQSSILDSAMQLDSRLQQWKFACVDRFPAGKPWEEPQASAADEFPVFRCRDPRTLAAFTPTWIVYPDLLLAMSMCFWWATRLILSADPSIPGVISPEERYQLACNICRSVRYYILGIPGCLVSRLMFVLRVAFDTFADGMIEKEYVTHLFGYVGEKFRFPVFSNKCTSFELRKTVDTGWREDSRRRKSE